MTGLKKILTLLLLLLVCCGIAAQTTKWRDIYKVKKKDTIFGIAKKYDLSVSDLLEANPEMKAEGYELKKGDFVFIPFKTTTQTAQSAKPTTAKPAAAQANSATIRVGIMLPLHDINGDGRRMVEYYRGFLMACDQLRSEGISTDIHAWNVPEGADIRQTLLDPAARQCDIIFGPLYTSQVAWLGRFCKENGIKMVIPFSINGDEVRTNPAVFQVYQRPEAVYDASIRAFMERFSLCHPVFIDCNDTTSRKGPFTFGLRKQLEKAAIAYSITNTRSSDDMFAKAFSTSQPNVVILNTARSPQLNTVLAKLNALRASHPSLRVSLFGYTEWLMYLSPYLDYYHKYDTYIPTTFYFNPLSDATQGLENSYRHWFHKDMLAALPRFALTGYDQAEFFLRGLHRVGKAFTGSRRESAYAPLQTPLQFSRQGAGGYQNTAFMLIHYKTDGSVDALSY